MDQTGAPNCTPLCAFSDRFYFTTFPSPLPNSAHLNRQYGDGKHPPSIRNASSLLPSQSSRFFFFTLDDSFSYNSFYLDWGPLNLAVVYRACLSIHQFLADEELSGHKVVLYSVDEPKSKANAALLASLYAVIVLHQAPWEAFGPIAELEFVPFRDAGRGSPDFNLSIQDCLWGMWKAISNKLCDMSAFSPDEYEFYEKVENGDWNWITPNILAFASPSDPEYLQMVKKSTGVKDTDFRRPLPQAFQNCLDYFDARNVKVVVRLNSILYDRQIFIDRNIDHAELFFEDGTNPTDDIVRSFLRITDDVITRDSKGVVAVHCKAGLGRTGTLIGAFLIWKYGFTANEAIAFMRIARPGSVVGPQQHYLYLKQAEWLKWTAEVPEMCSDSTTTTPVKQNSAKINAPVTPSNENSDDSLPILRSPTKRAPTTPSRHVLISEAAAREIATPGQPRKTPKGKRVQRRAGELSDDDDDDELSALPMSDARPLLSKLPKRKLPNIVESRLGFTVDVPKMRKGAGSKPALTAITRYPPQPPSPSPTGKRRPNSPQQSRLRPPTAIKRPYSQLAEPESENKLPNTRFKTAKTPNAWPSAKVTTSGVKHTIRPTSRTTRRRRSSLSAVDVIV